MSELKPCPFCGSRDIDYGVMTGTMRGFTYCQCEECGAELRVAKPHVKDAIAQWNRRASDERK